MLTKITQTLLAMRSQVPLGSSVPERSRLFRIRRTIPAIKSMMATMRGILKILSFG
ncbi:MAG: hypothetical protein K0M63_02025 [Weeksellaceae bacterium]|nr:hypothetical protein [Weeksellaceae bacterium]